MKTTQITMDEIIDYKNRGILMRAVVGERLALAEADGRTPQNNLVINFPNDCSLELITSFEPFDTLNYLVNYGRSSINKLIYATTGMYRKFNLKVYIDITGPLDTYIPPEEMERTWLSTHFTLNVKNHSYHISPYYNEALQEGLGKLHDYALQINDFEVEEDDNGNLCFDSMYYPNNSTSELKEQIDDLVYIMRVVNSLDQDDSNVEYSIGFGTDLLD